MRKMLWLVPIILSLSCVPKAPKVDLCDILAPGDPTKLLYCSDGNKKKYNVDQIQASKVKYECLSLTDYMREEAYKAELQKDLASCENAHK